VLATSGRAVEAAGDVSTLLLDKTGTITYGNRRATDLHPVGGTPAEELARLARLASLADETPEGRSVVTCDLGPDRHLVSTKRGNNLQQLEGRWVIDASGRAGILRRHLGLGVEISHDVNAAWFRIGKRIVVDEWSDDDAWHARVPSGKRWMSTVQLVGEGYWIWIISLPSDATSIGIVADPRFVPYERIRRYEVLRRWLEENEPQLAEALPSDDSGLLDFRKLKKYAYGARRGLSPQRWALTGEAGLFLDPLYSTGVDFIAIANTLATRLIRESLDDGPEMRRRLKAYNAFYLGQFLGWEPAFKGQYEVFRQAQATAAKILWDNAFYFMFPVLLFNKGDITDLELLTAVREKIASTHPLNVHMQEQFRILSKQDIHPAGFPVASDKAAEDLFGIADMELSRDEILERIDMGVRRMAWMAQELSERLYEPLGEQPPALPCAMPPDHYDLMTWVPFEQRTSAPAEATPQPSDAWMIR